MDDSISLPLINRIEKRAIEAVAIAPIVDALGDSIGRDEVLNLIQKIHETEAYERGKNSIGNSDPNGIEELAIEVASWGEGGIFEYNILEKTASTYFFDVTQCPYHTKYKELGLVALGVVMSCCRDEPHARGFNPKLKLVRSKTLMEGQDCCDFRYYLESE